MISAAWKSVVVKVILHVSQLGFVYFPNSSLSFILAHPSAFFSPIFFKFQMLLTATKIYISSLYLWP